MGQKYKTVFEMKWFLKEKAPFSNRQIHPQVNGQLTVTASEWPFQVTANAVDLAVSLGTATVHRRTHWQDASPTGTNVAPQDEVSDADGTATRHCQCSVISFQKPSGVAAAGSNVYPWTIQHQCFLWLHCISRCITLHITLHYNSNLKWLHGWITPCLAHSRDEHCV
jgi:hypothetical protein